MKAYAAGGASALSVLTDGPFFAGSLDDVVLARAACTLPVLRKDFIVDAYQLYEARRRRRRRRAADRRGAGRRHAGQVAAHAREALGLEVLVEVHDADEVTRALAAGAEIIGVNNRDLRTFTVDHDLAARLRPTIPDDRLVVAESGIRNAADVARLRAAGVDAMLVGETLMRAPDPGRRPARAARRSSAPLRSVRLGGGGGRGPPRPPQQAWNPVGRKQIRAAA